MNTTSHSKANAGASKSRSIPVVILAGGSSRRFGSPKGFAEVNGQRLLDRVVEALATQTEAPVVLNADHDGYYGYEAIELVPDIVRGRVGPLAGIHAALQWAGARGYPAVSTVPVDMPFLPHDFLARLNAQTPPVIGKSDGRAHYVCGLWPTSLATPLREALSTGLREVRHWVELCDAQTLVFTSDSLGRDPFFNVNTPEELSYASDLALRG
ncbi:MAG: molybdenum cofactor guanylyltransferase [Pseudomonadota bacterium]